MNRIVEGIGEHEGDVGFPELNQLQVVYRRRGHLRGGVDARDRLTDDARQPAAVPGSPTPPVFPVAMERRIVPPCLWAKSRGLNPDAARPTAKTTTDAKMMTGIRDFTSRPFYPCDL